jgi:hypothetical protein
LWNAYARFSQGKLTPPLTVTLDQMVSAMLRESDNATADYLLARLGRPAMADVIKRYMASGERRPGYVDVPKSIDATIESWLVNPDEPASGHRNIGDFSGFESWGYRKELDGLFAKLEQAGAIQRVRHFNCSWLPWEPPLTGCIPGVAIVEQDYRTLETGYFMHSNTHTYTQLMTGLLYRDLLPPGVQKVIEPYLEWRLTLPQYSGFLRYGAKSGSLGTGAGVTILTRTSYAENRNRVKAAVTIQLQGVENGQLLDLASLSAGVSHFVDALVNDPVFAFEAHARLDPKGKAVNEPSLIARVVHLTASNDHLAIVVKVTNIGGAESLRPAAIRGIILDKRPGPGARFVTGQQREVRRLDPGESQTVEFHLGGPVIGNFLAVAVVPDILKELPGNPVTWQYERIRATVK